MTTFLRRSMPSLVASLIASLVMWSPAAAASPPEITLDGDAELSFIEGFPSEKGGTWTATDGDEVTLTTDHGTVFKDLNDVGHWRWAPGEVDGPADVDVSVTATDADGPSTVMFHLHVDNAPPYSWTNGPAFVPVSSTSQRIFLWSAVDPLDDVDTTVDCGSGVVKATGDWYIENVHTLRCSFATAGTTQVGVRASDDDGASADGRMEVRATTQVKSVADGLLVIDGPDGDDQLGGEIATPDLNGDGKADVVMGGTRTTNGPVNDPAYVQVVFGRSSAGTIDVDTLADGAGFRILGSTGQGFGRTMADAGDLNGDDFDDLVINASDTGPDQGVAYVIFGSTSTDDIDVSTMTADRGVRITGALGTDAGVAMAGIGDANGDGFDDVAISAAADADPGRVDLLFGRASFTALDLSALPADRGIQIDAPGGDSGRSIGGGDVNGDGRADLLLSSRLEWASRAGVVYGRATMHDLDTDAMTSSQGFTIGGNEGLGITAVAAGDMDRDGYDEVAIAHFGWDDESKWAISIIRGGKTNASIPYVASAPSSRLLRVLARNDQGQDLTALDWNGDGRADLLVGGPFDQENGEMSGSAYLIKGTSTLSNLDLGALDSRWVRIDGDNSYAFAGDAIAAGDVTGDGLDDLLVGAPGATSWTSEHYSGRVGVFAGTTSDHKAPTVTAPVRTILSGAALVGSSPLVRMSWTGSDSGSGVDHFVVAQRTDAGAWTTIATTATTTLRRALATGHDYRFRVKAVDRVGNPSAWSYGSTFHLSGYQETSSRLTYTGTWKTGSSSTYAGGHTRYATAPGARATMTFSGRALILAGPTGPTRGVAQIYIDGVLRASLSLYSATAEASQVLAKWSWSSNLTHSLSIRVVGTSGHPRVDVDRIIVVR